MTTALVGATNQDATVGGITPVTVALPVHGPTDLTVVAVHRPVGVTIPRRAPGTATQPVDVPGWVQVFNEGQLTVLARWGQSPDPTITLWPAPNPDVVDIIAASFSGTGERMGTPTTGTTDDPPDLVNGPGVLLDVDGAAITVVASTALTGAYPVGWTGVQFGVWERVAAAYWTDTAGFIDGPAWPASATASVPWYAVTIAVEDHANRLVVARSASTTRAAQVFSRTRGEVEATFTEVDYPSDGIPPAPLPVLTPAHPWSNT